MAQGSTVCDLNDKKGPCYPQVLPRIMPFMRLTQRHRKIPCSRMPTRCEFSSFDGEFTPLHIASKGGGGWLRGSYTHPRRARHVTYTGRSNYTWRYKGGHAGVVCTLNEHCARVTTRDVYRWAPLHRESKPGHIEFACILIKSNTDSPATDKNGRAPLHCVAAHRHVEVACILVEYGVDATAAMGPGRLHFTEPRLGGT